MGKQTYSGKYEGARLARVAFPLGGIGAGMICLEGTGALSHFSLRNKPDVYNEPCTFAALFVKGKKNVARVLEGPIPKWKYFGLPQTGNGATNKTFGLPRFKSASFTARFPFATVDLSHPDIPLKTFVTGWSPFIPGDGDSASLPAAGLEYRFVNRGNKKIDAVFSFNTRNFMAVRKDGHAVLRTNNGFLLAQSGSPEKPFDEGYFSAVTDAPNVKVNCGWFRGGWFDPLSVAWKEIAEGLAPDRPPLKEGDPSPGAGLFVSFTVPPRSEKTIRVMLNWYVPYSDVQFGKDQESCGSGCSCNNSKTYRPWYAGKFPNIESLSKYWRENYDTLREDSLHFSNCFHDTNLPEVAVDAVAANLTIMKSPTMLRQIDGRVWSWEGCSDTQGCCSGSCTHVWNYAQSLPHLFPSLERTLRATEFNDSQDERGHQMFRSGLPIRPIKHEYMPASDGQLGGIMKIYREWRISGDIDWLRSTWKQVKASLDYCIEIWDPEHKGYLIEPHHNTYDIEFWGPDGMCSSFYLGALKAAYLMASALGENASFYRSLFEKGKKFFESELFNGEYFIQKVVWKGLRADPLTNFTFDTSYSTEALDVYRKEGPKYQYGSGCLSDGIVGLWMAEACGLGTIIERKKTLRHLLAVHKYNFIKNFSNHANTQRPSFALGDDAGLVLCSWPKGGRPTLPFVYCDEVFTGIEYQVAAHLIMHGKIKEGLDIVRACRKRYNGEIRNPFNEYECGHWYARAMASYSLLQAFTGARYDAVEKTLYFNPVIKGDFRAFISTAEGYGTVGVKKGKPFIEVKSGGIQIDTIVFKGKSKAYIDSKG